MKLGSACQLSSVLLALPAVIVSQPILHAVQHAGRRARPASYSRVWHTGCARCPLEPLSRGYVGAVYSDYLMIQHDVLVFGIKLLKVG
jgi:hypothetical protein